MNRHKAASINIRRRYLEGKRRARMRGYPHSDEPEEAMKVEQGKRRARMRGYPHSDEPEEAMKVELWVGVSEHPIK
jgi:hypothetical protein